MGKSDPNDMKGGYQDGRLRGRTKFSLEEFFSVKDAVSNVEERKFEKARDVIIRQCTYSSLPVVQSVLRYYHALIREKAFEEVRFVPHIMFNLMQEENEITADDIQTFARKLKDDKRFLDAFLCFVIAAKYYELFLDRNDSIEQFRECAKEVYFTLNSLLKSNKQFMPFVMNCGILEMKTLLRKIQNTKHDSLHFQTMQEVWCIKYMYGCYSLAERWKVSELILMKGVAVMHLAFGEGARKYSVYGLFLNNLGFVHSELSRYDEADKYYQLALKASKEANDYVTEEKRLSDMTLIKQNLAALRKVIHRPENRVKTYL